MLDTPFISADVTAAIKGMHPSKAPGPDGFHAGFFQRYWHIVGKEVTETVLQVLEGNPMPFGLNDTFITLIPKVPSPQNATQFRPIGLCNVIYKVISKCIVNKLKEVLPDLISPVQSSFVPGRQITDNVILMQEAIHSMRCKRGNTGWMAIKLDLEKAYDRLRWEFIQDTLSRIRLPASLINVIMQCITSSTLNVLWNGVPTETFMPTRGIRQGDPLSPYLFVACIERLSQLIEASCAEGHWQALPFVRGGMKLSHLMFADDVVLFCKADLAQAQLLKECLHRFCEASGQKISTQKSKVYFSPNTNEAVIAEVCGLLAITHTKDLGRYLGVPVLHGRVTSSTFQDVVTRVDQRLTGWKTKCLSLAGRATLIQSTLATIPAYVMQSTRLPRSICDLLDKKVRRFLWGGTAMERKTHLVSWNMVTRERTQGGLGIRSMRQLNSAYLMKLGWRLTTEADTLWVRVLKDKYCRGRDLATNNRRLSTASNVWKGIQESMELTKKGLGITIGDGRTTEFWNHIWLDDYALRDRTQDPVPEDQQRYRVRDYWHPELGWDWVTLSQFLPNTILHRLASVELLEDIVGDLPVWKVSQSGASEIKSAIQLIQGRDSGNIEFWSRMWKIRTPHRVRYFIWLLLHGRILTNAEKVRRRLGNHPQCDICLESVEDLQHLFRQCHHAQNVWNRLAELEVCCVAQGADFREWLHQNLYGSHVDPYWPTKFTIILWYIWKWRCAICHNNIMEIPRDIGEFMLYRFKEIIKALDQTKTKTTTGRSKSVEQEVRWERPRKGWMRLNTDGSVKGNVGSAGAGGVIRNDRGEWVSGFSEYLGHCSSMTAELKALLRGLKLASRMGITKLEIRVDSKVVVELVSGKRKEQPQYHFLISQCKQMICEGGWEVELMHCFRETNHVADKLANIGTTGRLGVTLYQNPPMEIQSMLYYDSLGPRA